ncbi:MAG: sigma 54-interacting transcriptional regulator [Desulfuromonadaceae bacterium]|nr:sigma 54-interacting transcriptional regulator [Desulfuromonadaceae bacterium]
MATLPESELFGHAKGSFTGAAGTIPACSKQPTAAPCLLTRSGIFREHAGQTTEDNTRTRGTPPGESRSRQVKMTASQRKS